MKRVLDSPNFVTNPNNPPTPPLSYSLLSDLGWAILEDHLTAIVGGALENSCLNRGLERSTQHTSWKMSSIVRASFCDTKGTLFKLTMSCGKEVCLALLMDKIQHQLGWMKRCDWGKNTCYLVRFVDIVHPQHHRKEQPQGSIFGLPQIGLKPTGVVGVRFLDICLSQRM